MNHIVMTSLLKFYHPQLTCLLSLHLNKDTTVDDGCHANYPHTITRIDFINATARIICEYWHCGTTRAVPLLQLRIKPTLYACAKNYADLVWNKITEAGTWKLAWHLSATVLKILTSIQVSEKM